MTALTVNVDRRPAGGIPQNLRMEANANPFQGSLGSYRADGYVGELAAGEPFAGLCLEQIRTADAAASDGARTGHFLTGIFSFWAVVSGIAITDVDAATKIYASDDNTLTTSSTGNTLIGTVEDFDGTETKIRAATKHVAGAIPA